MDYIPDYLIYIDTPPEECYRRIIKRSDGIQIPIDYLQELDAQYKSMLEFLNGKCRLLVIDSAKTEKQIYDCAKRMVV